MDEPDLLSIGDFARASGLTPKALRLYGEMGLLLPSDVDDVTGYRWYGEHQLDRARLVARLRLLGMPLTRIRSVVDLDPGPAAAELTSYWRQVEADTASARALLVDVLATLEETDMTITTHPAPVTGFRFAIGGRESQQDAVLLADSVYAVADGFGDAPGLADAALAEVALLDPVGDPVSALDTALSRAAGVVAERFAGHPGAGTTVTAVVLRGDQAVLAHVGDSRAYLVREGRLERWTRDHTVAQTLIDEGRLTLDEARADDRRVMLNRAVAVEAPYLPDVSVHGLRPGDRIVLTTDGVHGEVDPATLADLLTERADADAVAGAVAQAVEDAGAPDNYAVLVIDLD